MYELVRDLVIFVISIFHLVLLFFPKAREAFIQLYFAKKLEQIKADIAKQHAEYVSKIQTQAQLSIEEHKVKLAKDLESYKAQLQQSSKIIQNEMAIMGAVQNQLKVLVDRGTATIPDFINQVDDALKPLSRLAKKTRDQLADVLGPLQKKLDEDGAVADHTYVYGVKQQLLRLEAALDHYVASVS
jgi:ABC-type transporter Mla subunit MlaD